MRTDPTQVHIINHTHWDREWFLTSIYTSRWIAGLIDRLEQLAAQNPDFRFFLDGQTLVIEDLLALEPRYEERVRALIEKGQLIVGPYYCQPDWQLTGGELLLRNLLLGREDVRRLGGKSDTGWLVDTFGHISQGPQLHRLFDIQAVYIWRGAPQLVPYFEWVGPDGSRLPAINLFGGYRNLYGVTHAPEVALRRLRAEVGRLRPYYPTPDIPLFDGYDLEDDPEDPMRFYEGLGGAGPELSLIASSPGEFVRSIGAQELTLPEIAGELNSGKYAATFPGTLSARVYLKMMARDCERLLFRLCEPLGVMARLQGRAYDEGRYEGWARALLQNAVHDCICGVSIDQVHEKMEYSYRQLFEAMSADVQASLAAILHDFEPGVYAVSTNAAPWSGWMQAAGKLLRVKTGGVGVWPVTEQIAVKPVNQAVDALTWENAHYTASVGADGVVQIAGGGRLGALTVWQELGDTYSEESGPLLGRLTVERGLHVVAGSGHHRLISYAAGWQDGERRVTAQVRLRFDSSPVIRWQVALDSRGSDLRVEVGFETGRQGRIRCGMPFDVVERRPVDGDLLPRELPPEPAAILLGQRELGVVSRFPFHDFVAVSDGEGTTAVLAKGLHAYSCDAAGRVSIPLRRSVEWLTRAELQGRVGDAGPFFYVPDARGERVVRHELGAAINVKADDAEWQTLVAGFLNPPLIVRHKGAGRRRMMEVLSERAPLSSLQVKDGAVLARFFNPTGEPMELSAPFARVTVWGEATGRTTQSLAPKEIQTVLLPVEVPEVGEGSGQPADVTVLTPVAWSVGENEGRPDEQAVGQLRAWAEGLKAEAERVEARLAVVAGAEQLRLLHRSYIVRREELEYRLSLLLNERKLAEREPLRYGYLYELDEEIAVLGLALNKFRIKRRIFDYVVQAVEVE